MNKPFSEPQAEYENLVFQGGGVRGLAYLGALEAATQGPSPLFDFKNIKRVVGASAGAITALSVGLGYSLEEMNHISGYRTLPHSDLPIVNFTQLLDLPHGPTLLQLKNQKGSVIRRLLHIGSKMAFYNVFGKKSDIAGLYEALKKGRGLCSGQFARDTFDTLITRKSGLENTTFEELANIVDQGFKKMYFVGVNLTQNKYEIFSLKDTPGMPIADAVRISMGIPILFTPQHKTEKVYPNPQDQTHYEIKNTSTDLYIDGGLHLNYPIHLFDDLFPNPNTLGFRLVSLDLKKFYEENIPLKSVHKHTTGSFLKKIVHAFYDAQEALYNPKENNFRTIHIAPVYTDALSGKIQELGMMDFEKVELPLVKNEVYLSGQEGVKNFLKNSETKV